jgi:hypothetical protein
MATIHLYPLGTISCLCFICRVHFLFLIPISEVSHIFLDGAQPVLCLETSFQRITCGQFPVTNSAKQCAASMYATPQGVIVAPPISQPELLCLLATYPRRMPVFGCTYLSAHGVLITRLMSHDRVAICVSLHIMWGNGVQGGL